MVWLDGLDIPIVRLLNASFAEPGAADVQAVTRPEGDSLARYGNNLLPVDWKPAVKTSPVFNYPYARTREALDALARSGDPDPYHGHKLRYVNPATGESAMPTIGTFIQLSAARLRGPAVPLDRRHGLCLRRGRRARRRESGDDGAALGAARHLCRAGLDAAIRIMPTSDAVLFSFSDRPVQEKLGLWREARGNA